MGTTHVGQRFRLARDCAGITRRQAAAIFGVDQTTVYRWETGDIGMSLDTQIQAATEFGVDRNWLVFGEGAAPKRKPQNAKAS